MTTELSELTSEDFINEILAICDATPDVTNPQDPFSGCVYNALPSDYYADYYDEDGYIGFTSDYEESIRSGEATLQGKPAEAFAEHCLIGQWLSTRDIAVPEERNTDTGAKELLGLLENEDGVPYDLILPEEIPKLAQQVQQLADSGVFFDVANDNHRLIPGETHRTWGRVAEIIREHGDILLRNTRI